MPRVVGISTIERAQTWVRVFPTARCCSNRAPTPVADSLAAERKNNNMVLQRRVIKQRDRMALV